MRTQIIVPALLAILTGIGAAQAQEPRDFSLLAKQTVQLPGTTHGIVFNSPELQVGERRDTTKLSEAIAAWLSSNFGLPPMRQIPQVAYGEGSKMNETPAYDNRSHTIYLPVGWNGSSPTELSGFVREMVHHLQSEIGADYQCTSNFAAAIESRWLAMFGAAAPQVKASDLTGPVSSPRCIFRQSRVTD
jgi:hypothetical protein